MRKGTILSIVLLVFVIATGAFAGGVVPGLNGLKDTTWVGVLTFVDTGGNTQPDNATFTFTAENGIFLAGILECKPGSTCGVLPADPNGIEFSCIRDGNELQMAAQGYSISAVLATGPVPKKWNPPRKIMMLQGSDTVNGKMFQGNLTFIKP